MSPTFQNRRRNRRADVIKVQIEDVNLKASQGPMAQGRDRKDWGLFDIDLSHGVGGAFPTPTVGEIWWIKRGGRQWVLDHKVDSTRTPSADSGGGGGGGGGSVTPVRSSIPGNVVLGFNVREKKTTLEYSGFVTFDQVTTDADGNADNPEHYLIEWVPVTKNANILPNQKVRQLNWSANDPAIDDPLDPAADYYAELPGNVPLPKVWYWKARARAVSSTNAKGGWSDWTDPVLPVKVGLPQPPAPGNVSLGFKWKDSAQQPIFSAITKFDDVNYWDIPGYDFEDDVSSYQVQLEPLQKAHDWASGTDYTTGQAVLSGGIGYICIKAHTSSGGNTPPNATYWYVPTSVTTGGFTYVRADPNGDGDPWPIRRAELKDKDAEDTWVTLGTLSEDISGNDTIFDVDETGVVGVPAAPFIILVSSGIVDDGTFEKLLVTNRTSLGGSLYEYEVFRQFGNTPFLPHSLGAALKWLKDPYVYKVDFHHIERPRTVYWRTRARSKDRFNRLGPWSAYTAPITPWQSIDWQVPKPQNLQADIQIREYKTHPEYKLVAKFKDAAPNGWNLPGGDLQDDLAHYEVRAEAILPDPDGYIDGGDGRIYRIPDRKIGTLASLVNPADTSATVNVTASLPNSIMQTIDTTERFFLRIETVDPDNTSIKGNEIVAVTAVDEPTNSADLSRVVTIVRAQKGSGDHGHNANDNVYLLTEQLRRAHVKDRDEDDPGHFNDHYEVDFGYIPHAGRIFWHVRAQSVDTFGHHSEWTDWTLPINPATDPDLIVDYPTYVALSFDKVHRSRQIKHRAIVEWSEVYYTAPDGDREPDTSRYGVQLATSDGDSLDLEVSNSTVTFQVNEMKKGPGAVPFYCLVDDELVKVTARSHIAGPDNLYTYTVQRNAKGTTAAAHPQGSRVFQYPFFHQTVSAKQDADPNDYDTVPFNNAQKWSHYKARVRAFDRYNRVSDWSPWTRSGTPSDTDPPDAPTNVLIDVDEHKTHVTWDYPVDPRDEDPDLPQSSIDVAFFQVQLADQAGFGPKNILRFDRNVLGLSKTWRMSKPSRTGTYYTRVRAVDSSGNKSSWVVDSGAQDGVPTPDAPTITFDTQENSEKLRADVLLGKGVTYLDATAAHDALIAAYEFRLDPAENTKLTSAVAGAGDPAIHVKVDVSITMPYSIWIDNEKMTVNTKSGAGSLTWNVSRGVGGTTPVAHRTKAKVFYFKDATQKIIQKTGEETNPGDPVLSIFKAIKNRRYYRAEVRAQDTQGRWGNFSGWSTVVRAVDTTPPDPPISVTIKMAQHHVVVNWEAEPDPEDSAVEADATLAIADDVSEFQVQLARDAGFTDIVRTERAGRTTSMTFRVEKPTSTTTFYAQVRAVDERGNKSGWTSSNSIMTDPTTPAMPSLSFDLNEDPTKLTGSMITNVVTWSEDDISRYEFILQPTQWTKLDGAVLAADQLFIVQGNNGEYADNASWFADVPTSFPFTVYVSSGEQIQVNNITGVNNFTWHVTRGAGATDMPDNHKLFYFPVSTKGTRKQTVHALADAAETTTQSVFSSIPADKYYKGKVRSISRDNRQSAFSSYTSVVKAADGATSGPIGGGSGSTGTDVPAVVITDGDPPPYSPTPTVRAGVGFLTAEWDPVPNNDKVTYEVHVFRDAGYSSVVLPTAYGGTQTGFPPPDDDERFSESITSGFVAGQSTLYSEIDGTLQFVYSLPNGFPLIPGNTYLVKIIAKDADGAAPVGLAGSATIIKLPSSSATTDGIPPTSSPTPVIISGPMMLNVSWPATQNNDPVTYKVYCSTSTGFTPSDGSNLVSTTTALNFPITKLFGGTALLANTTYFVKILSSDDDGPAPAPGSQASGTVNTIPTSGSSSDGSPPTSSPIPRVTSGPRQLNISWLPIDNNDPVTYKVYCSPTRNFILSDFPYTQDVNLLTPHIATASLPATFENDDGPWSQLTPGASNLMGQTTDLNFVVTKLNDGLPLLPSTTYFIKIVAFDEDGLAPVSLQASGRIAEVSDGRPPTVSPTPTVQGGPGFLAVKWDPISNNDKVTYEVHVSTSNPPVSDATSLIGEVDGTLFFIKQLPDGTALEYYVDPAADPQVPFPYYIGLIAKDSDGKATMGTVVTGSMVQVNTDDIFVNAITAEKILAGEVVADKLETELVIVNTLTTAAIDPDNPVAHIEIDSDGIHDFGNDGGLLVEMPTDGSPVFIDAQVQATTMSVSGEVSLAGNNTLTQGSITTLQAAQQPPNQAPALGVSWDSVSLPVQPLYDRSSTNYSRTGLDYSATGGLDGNTHVFWTLGQDSNERWKIFELLASDRTVNRTRNIGGHVDGIEFVFGICQMGLYVYVVVQLTATYHSAFQVLRFAVSDLTNIDQTYSTINWPRADPFDPHICSNGTNIFVVDTSAGMHFKWTKYDADMQQVTAAVDSGYPGLDPSGVTTFIGDVAAGNFDFGANRLAVIWSVGSKTTSTIDTFDLDGTRHPNEQFTRPASTNGAGGLTYGDALADPDGARFWSMDYLFNTTSSKLTKHSTWTWTTESPLYWVAYSWYNSVSTHETMYGPRASITMDRRKRLHITTDSIPAGDPDSFKVYMKRNATDPGATACLFQTPFIAGTTTYLRSYDGGGATGPASNSFADGTPALLQDAAGTTFIKGDGTVAFPMRRTMWLPPAAIELDHDVPASKVTFRGTSPNQYETIGFANGSTTGIQTMFQVPADWASGALTMTLVYACTVGETQTVVFQWTYKHIVVGTTSGTATGTTPSVDSDTFTHGAVPVRSNALTIGTPASAGDLVRIQAQRLGGNGLDTCTGTTHLLGLEIAYSASR